MTDQKAEELLANPDLIIGLAQQVKSLKAERDEAVQSKSQIACKSRASAMGKAGVLSRNNSS